jgi:hypothetical protein
MFKFLIQVVLNILFKINTYILHFLWQIKLHEDKRVHFLTCHWHLEYTQVEFGSVAHCIILKLLIVVSRCQADELNLLSELLTLTKSQRFNKLTTNSAWYLSFGLYIHPAYCKCSYEKCHRYIRNSQYIWKALWPFCL